MGSSIREDGRWRVVATFPHTDPLPYEANAINPLAASWLGAVDGRLYVGTQSIISRLVSPRMDPIAVSFSAEGDTTPLRLGTVWPVPFDTANEVSAVLDVGTHYYGWGASDLDVPQLHKAAFDTRDETMVFDGAGVTLVSAIPPVSHANPALDLTISQTTDANLSAIGVLNAPVLFVREHSAAAATGYTIDRRELVLAHDLDGSAFYSGGTPAVFDPVGSVPHVFQVAAQGPGDGNGHERFSLLVFSPSSDASSTAPGFKTLRATHAYPLTGPMDLRIISTPHGAWLLLEDKVNQKWRVYRFDRSTGALSFEYELASPLRPNDTIVDAAVTDDGAIYVSANAYPVPNDLRVVRVTDGAATELWDASIEQNPAEFHFFALYSTGARVYAAVADTYPSPTVSLSRPRFTFITPDVPAVGPPPAPGAEPPPLPPPTCNPLTNAPCSARQACDVGPSRNGWTCAEAGTGQLCEACNPETGPYCAAGYTCRRLAGAATSGSCLKTCCTNEDCGGTTCVVGASSAVGYCATYNGTIYDPTCSGIPTGPAPSGGACSEIAPAP
ncbi:MAG: hypothetical protein U0414_30120 [Polyangiaceae bacterium]